jgi:large subunit ribosomal protein L19
MNKDMTIRFIENELVEKKPLPVFGAGDTITVKYRIVEGAKERIQNFQGVVLQVSGKGVNKMFTVRKISNNIGVERIFPITSPFIDGIEVNKRGKVRRARILYFRKLKGKKARIQDRIV